MYDRNCFELAEWFLQDEQPELRERAAELAQTIQDAIETWIIAEREPTEATAVTVDGKTLRLAGKPLTAADVPSGSKVMYDQETGEVLKITK